MSNVLLSKSVQSVILIFLTTFFTNFGEFIVNNIQDFQELPQSQIIGYKWHQGEEQTSHDRQYTSHSPKENKAAGALCPN